MIEGDRYMKLGWHLAVIFLMVSVVPFNTFAEKKKRASDPLPYVEFDSSKQLQVKKIKAPKFSFSYPSVYHVHSYDGQSININDWRSAGDFSNSAIIVKWRKGSFNQKEEAMYLKMGNGKSAVKMMPTKSVGPTQGKKLWAIRAQYNFEGTSAVPITPPDTYKGGKSFVIKPAKAVLDEGVVTLRCGGWNVLVNYKSRAEKDYSTLQENVDHIVKSFKCS